MKKKIIVAALAATIMLTACSSNGSGRSQSSSKRNDDEIKEEEALETESETEAPTNTPTLEENDEKTWTREGEYIVFGHYEQDGDLSNGPEPIEWEILRKEKGRMLLVSRYILDAQHYNTVNTDVTWETCSLRKWLNDDFISTAFNASEQKEILTVTNTNPDNESYGTKGGNDTEDKVFCLSVEEILDNYEVDQNMCSQALVTEVTQYAIDKGAWNREITSEYYTAYLEPRGYTDECIGLTSAWWWLRSPGLNPDSAAYVYYVGDVSTYSDFVDYYFGVRPALWLDLNS